MDIQTLKKSGQIIQVPVDEYVFHQGENGSSAYFILKGSVEVLVSSEGDGSLFKLAELKEGSIFGEMTLVDQERRSANIRTQSDCVFLEIDESHFDQLVQNESQLAHNLLETMAYRLFELHQKIPVTAAECDTKNFVQEMAGDLIPVTLEKGQKLYCKGEYGNAMLYITEGTIILSGLDDLDTRTISTVEAGGVAGVANMLTPGIRHETAEAIEESQAIIVTKDKLEPFLNKYPHLFKEIIRAISQETRVYNERFMELNWGIQSGGYDLVEKESTIVTKSQHSKMRAELFQGLDLNAFLTRNDVKCPICGETSEVLNIRNSKLELKSITHEFRKIHAHFDELWYHIWACPKCKYHNYAHDFFNLTVKENYNLKKQLLKKKHNFRYVPKKKGDLSQVINEHFNLLLCKTLANSSALRQARVWLHLAWLNDDAGNSPERDAAYRKARELYEKGWYKSKDPLTLEEEQKLLILLGELYLRDGHYQKAREYMLKAVHRKGHKVFNRQAQNRLYDIREMMTEEQA